MTHLPTAERSGIRHFAFSIANTNFLAHLLDGEDEPDVLAALQQQPALLSGLFICFFNEEWGGEDCEAWLLKQLQNEMKTMTDMPTLDVNAPKWMSTVVRFADALATDTLHGVDHASRLLHCNGGSPIEMVFAVLTNVLIINGRGEPQNEDVAWRRASEMAMWLLDHNPPATPFTADETALV